MNLFERHILAERRKQLRFLGSLADLLQSRKNKGKQLRKLRRALLDFGSETDDNNNCAKHLQISNYFALGGSRQRGLILSPSKVPVAEAVYELETRLIKSLLRKRFPKMSVEESNALLRLLTLVFNSFEEPLPMKSWRNLK
jgi:hypothetical protein